MKIIECKEIMDGKAYGVTLDNGVKATAWADKINAEALKLAHTGGVDVEVDLKAYTSKTGKTGTNITSLKMIGQAPGQIEINPSLNNPVSIPTQSAKAEYGNVAQSQSLKPLKDDSIVAQVFIKCAAEMYANERETIDVPMGEYINNCVKVLHDAYKYGISLLKETDGTR